MRVTLDRAVTIAKQFGPDVINTVEVLQPQQVMLEVRFVEATRQAGRELGVQWNLFGQRKLANIGNRSRRAGCRSPTPAQPVQAAGHDGRRSERRRDRRPISPVELAGVLSGTAPFGVMVAKLHDHGRRRDRRDHQRAGAEGRRPHAGRAEPRGAVGRHRELPGRRRISRFRCPARSAR